MTNNQKPKIVLVHGIILSSWYFVKIRKNLSSHFDCYAYNYPSRKQTIDEAAQGLSAFLAKHNIEQCDFVVHSMGGLVVANYLKNFISDGCEKSFRTVALGSPLAGSSVAKFLSGFSLGRFILGVQKKGPLVDGIAIWPEPHELACIIGTKPIGIGRLLKLENAKNSDGTVSYYETQVDRIKAQTTLPVTHATMVVSDQVIENIKRYLLQNNFE